MSENDMELIKCVLITKKELELAVKNFEHASGELIDYYAYKMKADKAKIDYLIKQLKSKEISLNNIEKFRSKIV